MDALTRDGTGKRGVVKWSVTRNPANATVLRESIFCGYEDGAIDRYRRRAIGERRGNIERRGIGAYGRPIRQVGRSLDRIGEVGHSQHDQLKETGVLGR